MWQKKKEKGILPSWIIDQSELKNPLPQSQSELKIPPPTLPKPFPPHSPKPPSPPRRSDWEAGTGHARSVRGGHGLAFLRGVKSTVIEDWGSRKERSFTSEAR